MEGPGLALSIGQSPVPSLAHVDLGASTATAHDPAVPPGPNAIMNTISIRTSPTNGSSRSTVNSSLSTRSSSPVGTTGLRRRSNIAEHNNNTPYLTVKRVIGTTVTSSAGFSSFQNHIAYTAGAGIVLLKVTDHKDGEASIPAIESERFFCSPPNKPLAFSSGQQTATTVSQNTLFSSSTDSLVSQVSSKERDSFGFVFSHTPTIIKSQGAGNPGADDSTPSSGSSLTRSTSTSSSLSSSLLGSSTSSPSTKDKVKSTTCVAISPETKLLAVGETGYTPHVLIYSMAPDASRIPMLMLGEHRFGIKRLAFSPCGKFLASLGVTNDGFLHVWRLTAREPNAVLHSSNKCLSTVHDMVWISSNVLITAGMRHLRVWKLPAEDAGEEKFIAGNKPAVLQSRNVVLGTFSNVTFVSVAPVSSKLTLVATDRGEVGLVTFSNSQGDSDDSAVGSFSLQYIVDFAVSSIHFDENDQVLWITGPEDELTAVPLQTILNPNKDDLTRAPSPIKEFVPTDPYIVGMSMIRPRSVIRLTSSNELKITDFSQTLLSGTESVDFVEQTLRLSNDGCIRGIQSTVDKKFMTWSGNGLVRIWNKSAECVGQVRINVNDEIDELTVYDAVREEFPNYLAKVIATKSKMIIAGDRHGVMRIADATTGARAQYFHAHGSEIIGIAYGYRQAKESDQFLEIVTTSGRDRTVQVFVREHNAPPQTWELLQTLVGHKSSVNKVLVSQNCDYILACSNDRTISLHKAVFSEEDAGQIVAYMPERIITLKSTPCDLAIADSTGELVVSCNDKQVYVYKFPGGDLVRSYKTLDEKGDALVLKDVAVSVVRIEPVEGKFVTHTCLVGMGGDKSIRVYDHKSGQHLCSEWGHSEGVSGLEMIGGDSDNEQWTLASSGNDGCVFVWELGGVAQYYKKLYLSRRMPSGPFGRLSASSTPNLGYQAPVTTAPGSSPPSSQASSPGHTASGSPTGSASTSPSRSQIPPQQSVSGAPVRKVISKAEISRFLNKGSGDTATSPSHSSGSTTRRKTLPPLTSSKSTPSLGSHIDLPHSSSTLTRSSSRQLHSTTSTTAASRLKKPESPPKTIPRSKSIKASLIARSTEVTSPPATRAAAPALRTSTKRGNAAAVPPLSIKTEKSPSRSAAAVPLGTAPSTPVAPSSSSSSMSTLTPRSAQTSPRLSASASRSQIAVRVQSNSRAEPSSRTSLPAPQTPSTKLRHDEDSRGGHSRSSSIRSIRSSPSVRSLSPSSPLLSPLLSRAGTPSTAGTTAPPASQDSDESRAADIGRLCEGLEAVRRGIECGDGDQWTSTEVDRLGRELTLTLGALGRLRKEEDTGDELRISSKNMDEIVERLGDRLCGLITSRLDK